MYDENAKGISYGAGFFILIGLALAGLFVAYLVSIPVWTSMTGKSMESMLDELSNPANAGAAKIIQCINAIFGFFIPALLTASILNKKPMNLLGFSGKIKLRQTGLVILIIIAALLFSIFLSWLNEKIPVSGDLKLKFDKMEGDYNKQVEAIIGLNNFGEYVLALIIMAFLPALCEETLFRGGLQNFLTRSTKMPWLSIIIVSIIFSAAHFSYYGFLSRVFLGMILGLLYQYSGRIWLNITAHFINNAIAITFLYAYKAQGRPLKDTISDHGTGYWWLLALPVLVVLMILFRKVSVKQTVQESNPAGQAGINPDKL